MYEYLYMCIRDDILSGNIMQDDKLPSKREMAKNHNISVVTVENAYAQLLVEGFIYAKEKRGYYASKVDGNWINNSEEIMPQTEEVKKEFVVDFTSNKIDIKNCPYATWARLLRRTLLDEEAGFMETPHPQGVPELRLAIAEYLKDFRGLRVNPNNIIVGAGMEYLYGIIVQLIGHNKMIGVEDPGYQKISKVYESNGVKPIHLKLDKEGVVPKDVYDSKIYALHISPSHHYPTGIVMPVSRRQELLKWAVRMDKYIIEDEYDSEFRFSGIPILPMAGLDNRNVIYMNTFSKTLANSIRIAYMVLPDKLMDKYREKLSFYSSTVSAFEQYTLAAFIKEGYYGRHINRMRNYYRDKRDRIVSFINTMPIKDKVNIIEADAGLHFILEIKKKIDEDVFAEKLRERGVNISSLSKYCYNRMDKFKRHFIINYSDISSKDLKYALEMIDELI